MKYNVLCGRDLVRGVCVDSPLEAAKSYDPHIEELRSVDDMWQVTKYSVGLGKGKKGPFNVFVTCA